MLWVTTGHDTTAKAVWAQVMVSRSIVAIVDNSLAERPSGHGPLLLWPAALLGVRFLRISESSEKPTQ